MTLSEAMFDLNCALPMFGLMNLCNVFSVEWFLAFRKPFVDTSKQFTLHARFVISVEKCAYLLDFSVCLASMFFSAGHVSSYRWMVSL